MGRGYENSDSCRTKACLSYSSLPIYYVESSAISEYGTVCANTQYPAWNVAILVSGSRIFAMGTASFRGNAQLFSSEEALDSFRCIMANNTTIKS